MGNFMRKFHLQNESSHQSLHSALLQLRQTLVRYVRVFREVPLQLVPAKFSNMMLVLLQADVQENTSNST